MCRQGVNHCADVTVNKTIQIVAGHVDAVIGDAALREVVGADAFGAIACAYLAFTSLYLLGILFLDHDIKQACPKNFHCLDFIF